MATRAEIAAEDVTRCCYCGAKVLAPPWTYSIEYAVNGRRTELPLCVSCGSEPTPTGKEIRAFLATEEEA